MKTFVSLFFSVTTVLALGGSVAAAARPDLRGRVLAGSDQPLENASVFVFTAGPRTGVGTYCPSCYADCRKSAQSLADGTFHIESLDPGLIFRLLVTAPGFEPLFVEKVDPANGPVRATLKKQNLDGLGVRNKLAGRVLDSKGAPLRGAKVEFEYIGSEQGGCGGTCEDWGVQPLAVTDDNGSFLLVARREFDVMSVSVEARAFARRKFLKLPVGKNHTLSMTEGTTVTGRVLREDKPLSGAIVGLVSVDRSDLFTGEYEIAANEKGDYVFPNIPPAQAYYVYTRMKDAKANGGVARTVKFNAGADESMTRVDNLLIRPAFRVSGRVALTDGKPLPAGSRMWVGREDAWDSLADVDVPPDGGFRLEGIPAELITLGARARGYRLAEQNPSIDRLNPFRLMGRMSNDVDDFVILLEPGSNLPFDHFKDRKQARDKPLRSAVANSRP